MACKFEYKGKMYNQDELVKVLEQMPPSEASKFIPEVQSVPDAPFKKNWHELALKRAIKEAADNGYERLSWTPGEAQAARYDLSKQVDKIAVPMVNKDGTRSVRIDAKQGTPFKLMVDEKGIVDGSHSSSQFSGKPLSDVVGKEMAEKIMKLEKADEFSGDGLKIGGEGMKGFYDQIIPKSVEKIAKEYGVKVQKGDLNKQISKGPFEVKKMDDGFYSIFDGSGKEIETSFKSKNAAEDTMLNLKHAKQKNPNPVYYIDIPENMKQGVKQKGFPLFSAPTPALVAIDYEPEF